MTHFLHRHASTITTITLTALSAVFMTACAVIGTS